MTLICIFLVAMMLNVFYLPSLYLLPQSVFFYSPTSMLNSLPLKINSLSQSKLSVCWNPVCHIVFLWSVLLVWNLWTHPRFICFLKCRGLHFIFQSTLEFFVKYERWNLGWHSFSPKGFSSSSVCWNAYLISIQLSLHLR